jgi:hypothetical protein
MPLAPSGDPEIRRVVSLLEHELAALVGRERLEPLIELLPMIRRSREVSGCRQSACHWSKASLTVETRREGALGTGRLSPSPPPTLRQASATSSETRIDPGLGGHPG